MLTVIAHHFILPGKMDEAKKRIVTFGQEMRSARGFISRQTVVSQKDPPRVTSVTTWRTKEEYEAYNTPERQAARRALPPLYVKVESETFEVLPEL